MHTTPPILFIVLHKLIVLFNGSPADGLGDMNQSQRSIQLRFGVLLRRQVKVYACHMLKKAAALMNIHFLKAIDQGKLPDPFSYRLLSGTGRSAYLSIFSIL